MLRNTPAILQALGKAGKWLVTNKAGKTIPAGELGVRLGMDAMGAGMGALMTPGDVGDKAIAFGTDLGMSSVLGLGAGRLAGGSGMGATLADMAGSYAGAYGAMPVASKLMQAKDLVTGGRGETPWDKMGREQQEQIMAMAEQRALEQYMAMFPQSRALLGQQIG